MRSPKSPWRRAALALPVALISVSVAVAGCTPVQKKSDQPAKAETKDVKTVPLEGKQIVDGGDLVMALSNEPDALDPTTSSSLYTRYVMQTMCEKLYDIDENGKVIPFLATAMPTLSDDGLTVTIPLKDGVKFADGTPFNADAVKTTLERDLNKKDSSRASELGPITGIKAVDDHTVKITYKTPFAPLAAVLADRAGMIMSPKALAEEGDHFADHPVCVGPFKFVKRIPQTSITVERDPNYYDADKVHLDTITYRIITDASVRAANLKSGDVQVADSLSPLDYDDLTKAKGLGLLEVGSLGYQGLTINIGNTRGIGKPPGKIDTPLAQDRRVRQALALAMNRQELVRSVFDGRYDVACSPISPDSPFSTPASEKCPGLRPGSRQEAAPGGRRHSAVQDRDERHQHPGRAAVGAGGAVRRQGRRL